MVLRKSCRVWRKYRPRSVLLESRDVPDHALLFESDVIAVLSPVEMEVLKKETYTDSVAAYGSLGILDLEHNQVAVQYLVLVTGCQSVGKVKDVEVFKLTQATFVPLSLKARMELVQDVGKLLASGKFFFAYPSFGADFDLLSCAQKQGVEQPHFYWNKGLMAHLQRFGVDYSKWVFRTMCGHVEIQTVYAAEKQTKLCLFSRLSCERAGTRFNVRGINDDGHVANFVETEQAIFVDDKVASFVQIRGLVPLFWDQPGIQTGGGMTRIKFSRGYSFSRPAFERHFEWCLLHYGPILCLNLLGTRDTELLLTTAFKEHLSKLSSAYCAEMMCFDYHRICRGAGSNLETILTKSLLPEVVDFKSAHGFYLCSNGSPEKQQTGTIRTNCLDCLDRTNSVQAFLGRMMVTELLGSLGLSVKQSVLTRFKQQLSSTWFRNGDSLSHLYSGTGALKFEGKSKLKDGARSVKRTIRNNFLDSTKQEAIDMLLFNNTLCGELGLRSKAVLDKTDLQAPIPFKRMLCDRWSDYTIPEKLRVAIGTWNVNGGTRIRSIALKNQSLSDWLLDGPTITGAVKNQPEEFASPPDIYAIGFEELVGLTASNIVSASSSNRKEWGAELQKVLSRDHPYELVTAEQLVGVCLYIFTLPKFIPYIRDVAVSTVKTGLSGKAGNKGGVAIRFLLHSTSLCFVCSHFAAHQTKITERNQDFADICKKVSFPHGHSLDSHDYIFWCGDLNYRIDLPTTIAKDHIANGRWDKLYKHDQLFRQKKLRKVYQGYIEGELNFAPTYKYDEFSDDYDTSEKCRTPAWCDRILWKRRSWASDQTRKSSLQHSLQHYLTDDKEDSLGKDADNGLDFGPHHSDAATVCRHELGTGGEDLIALGHYWHPGRLIYYNRAELKQSDHRPVFGIIEVDIYRVDDSKRSEVRDQVSLELGPPNPTIVIEEDGDEGKLAVQDILEPLRQYGTIVLVRVTQDCTLVTFKDSPSAVAATALNGKEIKGATLSVTLRSPWPPGSITEKSERTPKQRDPPMVTVLTSEKLMGVDHTPEEVEAGPEESETLMEFTFSDSENAREERKLEEGKEESGGEEGADSDEESHDCERQEEAVLEEEASHFSSSSSENDLKVNEEEVLARTPSPRPSRMPRTSPRLSNERKVNRTPSPKPRPPIRPPRPTIPPVPSAPTISSFERSTELTGSRSSPNLQAKSPHPPPRPMPPSRPTLPPQLKIPSLNSSSARPEVAVVLNQNHPSPATATTEPLKQPSGKHPSRPARPPPPRK